jgi:hypothetical protein
VIFGGFVVGNPLDSRVAEAKEFFAEPVAYLHHGFFIDNSIF